MSKFTSTKSLLHGIVCCLAVLISAILINHVYPIDKMITASVSFIGMIMPIIIEKLTTQKVDKRDEVFLTEIEEIKIKLEGILEQINLNENSIIEIQSVLTCFNNPKISEDITQLKIDVQVLKERTKI